MASTFSTNLRLELQVTGENTTTWGTKANQVFDMIEDAISAVATVAMANTNKTLTTANGTADQARCMFINATGANTAVRTLTIPAVSKMYIIKNATTGGFAITVSNGTNSVSVANGGWALVWTDGTNMYSSMNMSLGYALSTDLDDLSGVTDVSGARTKLGLGTMALQNASAVALTGGTITGITDLAVADGGTGASTAAAARTNLGLGTIATQNANNIAVTGGTMADVAISGGSISGITDLGIADGGTGSSTAAGARTNLGLGTMATQNATSVNIDGGTITGITDLAVADGGTGASTAANARTNLGLGTMATQGSGNVAITGGTATLTTLTTTSDINCGQYVKADRFYFNAATGYIATGAASGTIYFYPNSISSSTGRCHMNINEFYSPGDVRVSGHLVSAGTVRSATTTSILATTGSGTIYLRPQGYNDAGGQATLNSSGTFLATGNVGAFSDARLKYDLKPITSALDKIEQLTGLTFLRNDLEGPRQTGLIAQDVQKVLPEAVIEADDGILTIAYGNLAGLFVEAIKELKQEVQDLRAELGYSR